MPDPEANRGLRMDGDLRLGLGSAPSRRSVPIAGPRSILQHGSMPFFEAVRIALSQIRAQKLKSFFTLIGVTIGVMFLIAVVAVVNGMGRYVEEDFAAKFLGVNTFNPGAFRTFRPAM